MTSVSRTTLTFTAMVAALALGCQGSDEGDAHDLLAQDSISCDPSIDGGVAEDDAAVEEDAAVDEDAGAPDASKPDKDQPYFADVVANGTGCPKGTWNANVSKDGASFDVTFSSYEIEVDDGQRLAFKDCNLTIKLHSRSDISYAVSGFHYEGYAFLENGVRAFQTANYYFQGNPVPSADKEKRTDLAGPLDRSYLFQDSPRTEDLVWSPCGLDRNLQVVTRIGIQKTQDKGRGYVNVRGLRGPKLIWKKCAEQEP